MKQFARSFVVFLLPFCCLWADNPQDASLIFHADFDAYSAHANHAQGFGKVHNPKLADLQLRMKAGVGNKGNALELDNSEPCSWSVHQNFQPRQGTVSMWISPVNWKPSKDAFQIFFNARLSHGYRMLLYKFHRPAHLKFTILYQGQDYSINVPLKDDEWQAGRWHKLDAVWDARGMTLYLDGRKAKQLDYTRNPLIFARKIQFPESERMANFGIGAQPYFAMDKTDKTTYDDVRIYDRALSEDEILASYERVFPPESKDLPRQVATIPMGTSISVDGKVGDGEWKDATMFPVACAVANSPAGHPAYVQLKQDQDSLFLAARIAEVPRQIRVVNHDDVMIWRDDSFEIHLFDPRSKVYHQLIVNARGSLYDARQICGNSLFDPAANDTGWTSGARCAVERTSVGWSVEMAVKKAALGYEGQELLANFCRTAYLEKPSFCAWVPDCQNYFSIEAFGRLVRGKAVRLERLDTQSGECRLAFSGEQSYVRDRQGKTYEFQDGRIELPGGAFTLHARQGHEFSYVYPFRVSKSLNVSFRCYPSRQCLEVEVNFRQASRTLRQGLKGGLPLEVSLEDSLGKVVVRQRLQCHDLERTVLLPLSPSWSKGTYVLRVGIIHEGEDHSEIRFFRIPDKEPYVHRVAVEHTVPKPWHPIRMTQDRVFQVLNAVVSFRRSPFPVSIRHGKDELLGKAPVFSVNQEPVQWDSWTVEETHDDSVLIVTTGKVGALAVSCRVKLSFDGLLHYEMSLKPDGIVHLENVRMTWEVPSEFTDYLLTPLVQQWGNEEGEALSMDYHNPGDFILWAQGVRKGLCYHPVSCANFLLQRNQKPFRLERVRNTTTFTVTMVSRPVDLKTVARYEFAFMPTPGKRPPVSWRTVNNGDMWGYLKHETFKINGYGVVKKPSPWDFEPWTGLVPAHPEAFREYMNETIAKGSRFLPYSQPCYVSDLEPDYDYFFPECKQYPGGGTGAAWSFKQKRYYEPEAVCGHTQLANLYVYRADKMLGDYPDVAGIYYDICQGRTCNNTLHGHGGTDAFGQAYADSTLLSMRDYFIRILKVIRKHGKILMLHAHNRFVPFVHGLGDFWFPGEQYVMPLHRNPHHFYCEDVPLRDYQSAYNSESHGVGILFFSQLRRRGWVFKGAPLLNDEVHTRMFLAPALVHDIGVSAGESHQKTIETWWDIKARTKLDKATFHGYWFSEAIRSGSRNVYVSWYEWTQGNPCDRLLVIANLGRENAPANLKVDWDKLRLREQDAYCEDLWTGERVTSLKTLTVKGQDFRLIGIRNKEQ